jgi:flagellin
MSLGVLNNLNAMYAENSLNNTSNSLNTVLQQLSSGSKINSGADDAAGLSLVDGLQANSMALAQSQTNASEGVGLLKVADGALSQVTNLLNRAVTLATEASNGTLNTSQDAAANSEYQSILSEINNIGTTTTYNNQTVFGTASPVNIYTGDSSTAGASIDALNIQSLSSSNVGDTGGVMSYSNGSNNVFLNLSGSNGNAKATDYLNGGATGTTTIDVSYLVKGANGASTSATASITAGGNSGYANTANGLMNAINNSGLGLSATFATQAQAGVQGGGTQTGIEVTGGQVAAGSAASTSSTSGILNPAGIPASELLTQSQTITISQVGASNISVSTTGGETLQGLASAINTATGNTANGGAVTSTRVIASVITNGDGTQSLSLGNANATDGALTVTASANPVAPPSLGVATSAFTAPVLNTTSGAVGANAITPAAWGSATFAVAGTNAGSTLLSNGGSITVTSAQNGNNVTDTFIIGANNTGSPAPAGTYYTGAVNTLGGLATFIQGTANLNVTASAGASGLTITSATEATGYNVTIAGGSTLTNASNVIQVYSPSDGGAATVGTPTKTELNAGSTSASQNDQLSGTITFSSNLGLNTLQFTAGTNGNTYADLVSFINQNSSTLGVTAQWSTTMGGGTDHGILLTSITNNATAPVVTVNSDTLGDATLTTPGSSTVTSLYGGANAAENDVLSGEFKYTGTGSDGQSHTVDFNTGSLPAGQTWADLASAINGANVGVSASWSAGNNALLLTSNTPGVQTPVVALTNTLTDTTNATGTAVSTNDFKSAGAAEGDFLTGTATFAANGKTFAFTGDGTTTSYDSLITALNHSDLNVTASWAAGALHVVSNVDNATPITVGAGLTDGGNAVAAAVTANGTPGSAGTPVQMQVDDTTHGGSAGTNGTPMVVEPAGTGSSVQGTAGAGPSYATAVLQLAQTGTMSHIITDGNLSTGAGSDTITGQISITNGLVTHTFVQGTGNSTATTIYTGNTTVKSLVDAINQDTTLGLSAQAPTGGTGAIYLQATTAGTDNGGISSSSSTLADVGNGAAIYGSAPTATTGQTLVAGNAGALTVGLAAGAMSGAPNPNLTVNSGDTLKAGSTITVGFNGNSRIFDIGTAPGSPAAGTTYVGTDAGGATLAQLAAAISGYGLLGVSATAGTTGLQLSSAATGSNAMITATSNLTDNTLGTNSTMNLNGFSSENDTVSGHLDYQVNGVTQPSFTLTSGETVQQMISQINLPANNSGLTAQWNSNNNSVTLTSNIEGAAGDLTALGTTAVTDTTNTATLTYTASNAYSTGISSDATNKVFDSTSGQSGSALAGFASNQKAGSGIATISYTDGAGQSLSTTDLSNATDAKASLTALNTAITDVAAQDGYIGAQINTLNAVSSVLSTQQQNVVSAQNAVQATDYASAASNMSKYEILSQTGISALAQANSMQQEVTKLLQ